MTIKEITTLRRNGHIEEALSAAEVEFATNANKYTAGALFWCLYDLSKNNYDQNTVESLLERMNSLYENFCSDDEVILKSIHRVESRLDPLGKQIKVAIENAKAGRNDDELLNHIYESFDKGNLKVSLYKDFGWLIYYVLRNISVNAYDERKRLLHCYLRLSLNGPVLLHSLILEEAVKVEKNTPLHFRIRDFMNLWGWDNLREDDWKQYQSENGHMATSLVEKLISVYAKELKTDGVRSPEEFEVLVDKALERYPDNQYIPFYKATVLKSKGENESALEYYKQLILKAPSKCYLWHQAAELMDDSELRIALLCKAISVERDESFKGNCRLDLAKALIEQGLQENAKCELNIYRNFYVSQGWNLKQEYRDLESNVAEFVGVEENHSLYDKYVPIAEEFVYSAIPTIFAIKIADKQLEDRNRPGRRITQWKLQTKNGSHFLRKPSKFGLQNRIKNGNAFDVKILEGRVVWIKESQQDPLRLDWIKVVEGNVRLRTDRNGNPYAILENAYIGKKYLNGISDGQRVKIVAVQQEDGRWTAISIKYT